MRSMESLQCADAVCGCIVTVKMHIYSRTKCNVQLQSVVALLQYNCIYNSINAMCGCSRSMQSSRWTELQSIDCFVLTARKWLNDSIPPMCSCSRWIYSSGEKEFVQHPEIRLESPDQGDPTLGSLKMKKGCFYITKFSRRNKNGQKNTLVCSSCAVKSVVLTCKN